MVNWPNACVGCGETDSQKLKSRNYTYRHYHQIGQRTSGNTVTTTYNVTSLPVSTYLCPSCGAVGRRRYISRLVPFLIILVGSWIAFIILNDYDELDAAIPFLVIGAVFIPITVPWAVMRRHLETNFHKVRYHYRRNTFTFIFKNQKFADAFKENNRGEEVKLLHWFP